MENEGKRDIWKLTAVVLAVLIMMVVLGAGILIVFDSTAKTSSTENNAEKKELTMILPNENEIKKVSSITVSKVNGSTNAENEEVEKATTPIESHRYEIVSTRMTWSEAAEYCENQGGYLATVESQEEYNKIVALAEASGRKVLWLGAVKNSEQAFEWITGEKFEYACWLENEPNNEGGNENCLVMFRVSGQWVWADVPNDVSPYYAADKVGFVCEYDE